MVGKGLRRKRGEINDLNKEEGFTSIGNIPSITCIIRILGRR